MNKKIVLGIFTAILVSCFTITTAYGNEELNRRLISCTPTKDFDAGNSTLYQITGITNSICIYKIQHRGIGNKPDLICKVPLSKMREMTGFNPIAVESLKNRYCVISIKSLNKSRSVYY